MGLKQVKVGVNDLVLGMFVSGLDRPWTQTPFPLQGFYLRDLEEINQLKRYCKHVYIDVQKGKGPANRPHSLAPIPRKKTEAPERSPSNQPLDVKVSPLKVRHNVYSHYTPLKNEVEAARALNQRVAKAISEIDKGLASLDTQVLSNTRKVAGEMVDSVLRNPDALSWLNRVRDADEHSYSHSVRSAIWAILFGRYIGLSKKDLDVLAFGVLLKDVGKVKLDVALLRKENRSDEEELEYEKFVLYGVEILRQSRQVEPRAIAVVHSHCERINGSGFPQHLKGDKIPVLGRIAGLVSFYDEISNPRNNSKALSPSRAVARLYELRNVAFQEDLTVEFIRAIGLYPTGTLVELSSGEVAVVVEQNFERRLKPKVMLVLDKDKQPLKKQVLVDLAKKDIRLQKQIDKGKKRLQDVDRIEISHDLEPSSYPVDIAKVRDDYLFSTQRKGILGRIKHSLMG